MRLEISSGQRFTCQQCGMCCRGAWVVVTPDEAERYRKVEAARWYTDPTGAADVDPFEPVAHGHFRIRKRPDGACGFLSDDNLCRIHQEMGAEAKPLACRVFPFRFHPVEGRPLATTSASCPTIVRNEGALLTLQTREIGALRAEWSRAFPEKGLALLFARGRPIEAETVGIVKSVLGQMLDAPATGGPADLRLAVARMAGWLDDLSRHRVARLKPAAFAEYAALTGRHAAETAVAPPPARASAVTRLLSRGFLFTVLAVREQAASSTPGLGRHLRRMRHLAHLHGLAPATATVDRKALARVTLDPSDPEVHRILQHALRSSVDGLGTGRRPLIDELAVEIATLVGGIALAAMAADRAGRDRIDASFLTGGITAAAQVGHADSGALGAVLPSLAGGVDALRLLEGWLGPRASR